MVGAVGWMIGVGLFLYDVLARDPMFPRPAILSTAKTREREPGLSTNGLSGGYTYPDAQVEFPERVCVELVQETLARGGEARSHTRVVALKQNGDRVIGAILCDELTGEESEVEAEVKDAFGFAESSAFPPPAELWTDVYKES